MNLSGYSKGHGYRTGQTFAGEYDHAWNAVYLDGRWHLVDSTWGSGCIDDCFSKFTFRCHSFYLLCSTEGGGSTQKTSSILLHWAIFTTFHFIYTYQTVQILKDATAIYLYSTMYWGTSCPIISLLQFTWFADCSLEAKIQVSFENGSIKISFSDTKVMGRQLSLAFVGMKHLMISTSSEHIFSQHLTKSAESIDHLQLHSMLFTFGYTLNTERIGPTYRKHSESLP